MQQLNNIQKLLKSSHSADVLIAVALFKDYSKKQVIKMLKEVGANNRFGDYKLVLTILPEFDIFHYYTSGEHLLFIGRYQFQYAIDKNKFLEESKIFEIIEL